MEARDSLPDRLDQRPAVRIDLTNTTGFALPTTNVTPSSTIIASLEAARDARAPVVLQLSNGGAAFFAGKGVSNTNQEGAISGAIAAAHFIRSIAPVSGVPVVLHTDHCAKKLLPWLDGMMDADEAFFKEHARAAPWKQWIEMKIGITGGEEDGVNNEDVGNNSLYTQPEDIWQIYQTLSPISPYFSIAAGFGNVHGVYQPGNVKLRPDLLAKHQAFVANELGSTEPKPVFLFFHGGSRSSVEESQKAIGHGVVKVNLDTDLQWAYLGGIRDYSMSARVKAAFEDFKAVNSL
ncbi:hypothetical protein QBC35DRAFT_539572 [Podospora australis]|uniref:Fructose-bisphosphate aldolase n=1 Tax=Podospora australis TaxID=1536484 RepID=A0AAN6X0C1_9PEZI|nr:hypothetical protein QBC35DRAFT_539572 [Podospora australis]